LPVCTPAHWCRSVACRRMAIAQADQGVTLSNPDTCMPCMCQTFHELHVLQFCIHALLVPASKRGKNTYGTEEVSVCVHVCACAKWKRSGCAVRARAWVCACACRHMNWVEWKGVALRWVLYSLANKYRTLAATGWCRGGQGYCMGVQAVCSHCQDTTSHIATRSGRNRREVSRCA
jgi:hypothetical protein